MSVRSRLETLREIIGHPASQHRKRQAAFDYVRWNVGHRLIGREYVLPLLEGVEIIVSDRQNFGTLAYVNGLWDFPEMAFLLHFLRPGDRFADLGANAGAYTLLASAGAGADTLACEPVPMTFKDLQRNIRLNGIGGRVEAHQCGLGAETGTMRMTTGLGGLNHVATEATQQATQDVPITRLDDLLAGRACAMIKLDAEGYEANILAGGTAALANPALHAMVVELNGSGLRYGFQDQDTHRTIVAAGFAPCRYDPATHRLAELPGFNTNGLNTLYVRRSGHVEERVMTARRFSAGGLQV